MAVSELDIRLWRDPVLGRNGTELQSGNGRRFGPLIRNEVTIAVVTSGMLRYRVGRSEAVAGAGQMVLVGAGEAFAGETPDGWSWRVFYPDLDTLADMASRLPAGPPPRGPQPTAGGDGEYVRRLMTLHRAIEANADNPLARQQAFAEAMGLVLASGALPSSHPRSDSRAIRRAIECVKARFSDPELSVAELAAAAGYSPYHFMRSFQAAVGVTAHSYVVQCRVHAARALLADGVPAAEVASAAGFADQSHLIRQFKAVHGITPGLFAEGCRRRAERRPAAVGERLGAISRR
ncbi:AraC family transcriptional regulator [Rhizomicrobium electricum]|jgi:AraC-like DNA-binding protein|uniref:AraC family transcriptional regulator n=1 Tax=Rhizomicrobium electricum TaxID=480070 RepID=A0ABP3PU25_9PROT|nr:AraC family transcriptional regulator [Rhizomicrobium electricum]NIJ48956.1 AraC-like DNA-binding protein [Rhizomicrobium electricum]